MVHYMVPCDVHDRCIFSAIFHSIGKRLMKRSMQAFCLLWFPLYSRCCFARLVHFAHYCSGAKPGLRILSPGFSEQSATDSFSTPFIRSEFLSFFLSEICSKTDADLNRKVFLKSSLQCNATERRFQKMHFPISFLDSSPIPWSPHLCGRIPWDGNGSLIFLFGAHFDLQEFVYICKNLFIFVRICLDLQEFV